MDNFFEELKSELDKNNLDYSILDKYKRQALLGKEAGLSDKEILKRFGSPHEIVMNYINNEQNKKEYKEISLNLVSLDKSIIETVEGNSIKVLYSSDEVKDLYEIEDTSSAFTLEPKRKIKALRQCKGAIKVQIGKNIVIKNLEINLVNKNNDFTSFTNFVDELEIHSVNGKINITSLNANSIQLSFVSGEVLINKIKAKSLDIDNVSSTIEVLNLEVKELDVSNVSGEVNLYGEAESSDYSNVSGKILLNDEIVTKTIGQAIKDALKRRGL